MAQTAREYITSERFIHDNISDQVEVMLITVIDKWREKRLMSFAVAWVSEPIDTATGTINDKVFFELPKNKREWMPLLKELVSKSKAYGLLLIEVSEEQVRALLETPHGSRCWRMKATSRGDYKTLHKPDPVDDVEELGLLWSKNRGNS